MEIKKLLVELDDTIGVGNFIGAVEKFFADDIKIISGKYSFTGKPEKLRTLSNFIGTVENFNTIQLHDQNISGDESWSLFTFDIKTRAGNQLIWHEIIRRKWASGKVAEEEYITKPSAAMLTKTFSVTPISPAPSPAKEEKKKPGPKPGSKRPVVNKSGEPRKKPGKKADPSKSPGELRQLKGLGPRVEQLFKEAGIATLEEFSKTPYAKIIGVLKNAGPRFKDFDASGWVKEANAIIRRR
jgi:predicted flap endonuclease-1-like 5' DNA nuclease